MPQLIITAVGPDRPGIVGEMSAAIHANGGNILDSRMVNLRGQFAILVLLECDSPSQMDQVEALGKNLGLHLEILPQKSASLPTPGMRYRMKTYSLDQPGIVARLTRVLREHGVNIEDLEARQESAPFAGSPLFLTEMLLTVPGNVPIGKLRSDLQTVGNELNCDIDLDPAD